MSQLVEGSPSSPETSSQSITQSTTQAGPETTNTASSTVIQGRPPWGSGPPPWGNGPPPWITAGGSWGGPVVMTTTVISSSQSPVSNSAISIATTLPSGSLSIATIPSPSVVTIAGAGQSIISPSSTPTSPIIPTLSATNLESNTGANPQSTINKPAIALGITIGFVLLILLLLLAFWYGRRQRRTSTQPQDDSENKAGIEGQNSDSKSVEIGSVMIGSMKHVEMEGCMHPVELDGNDIPVEICGGEIEMKRRSSGFGDWLSDTDDEGSEEGGDGCSEKGGGGRSESSGVRDMTNSANYW
ncbi:hypothetical protein HYFRA_00007784 [Hymenoscyphus fraxineus]|uniref:Uncharacterized protein n=1 Tax=Hymenoscyphus fraxineus TaxID=746836 RepID=A0A9N9PPK9_9HELO|nr:hypothetical protein HYFRA_00007784 [Hymenoscyphus fraxineus]